MSIKELEQEAKRMFEPQKEEVEKKFDDWSAVMKEATMMLSNWDKETDEGITLIDDTLRLGTRICVPIVQGHTITSYTHKLLTKCGRMWHLGGTGPVLTQ